MSTVVTIPTANYVEKLNPENCPPATDFDQQCKLWRFYCTCLDLGCNNYKLEDFLGKNMSPRDKYMFWLKDWKRHYKDVSELIRKYKRAKSSNWFYAHQQKDYREKLQRRLDKRKEDKYAWIPSLKHFHDVSIQENLDKLRRTAQHLLNARFTAKLASEALVMRQRKNSEKESLTKAHELEYNVKVKKVA